MTTHATILRARTAVAQGTAAFHFDKPAGFARTRFFRARGLLREGLSRDVDVALGDAFAFDGARCGRMVADVLARLAQERHGARS